VILKTCTSCKGTQTDTLTWSVWAWNRADGVRVAYKHKLCLACVTTRLAPLYVACESPVMNCPQCGIDTSEDMDPVYCTFVLHGSGKKRLEAPMCASCAVELRVFAMTGAEFQEDRDPSSRGLDSAPRYGSEETWRDLGFLPRE
jgi:hypothetical protein